MARAGGYSDGRDIGAVFNFPIRTAPGAADVWRRRRAIHADRRMGPGHRILREGFKETWGDAIAVALGGDASVATNGFWAALTMATTLKLPMLFYVEDNGYGISVPSCFQTPGAESLRTSPASRACTVLRRRHRPAEAATLIEDAVGYVRARKARACCG